MSNLLRLPFPRAKLRRQIFTTGRNSGRRIGRNFGRNFLFFFRASFAVQTTHQIFSPNSSQFITPCLVTAPVTEISKFHLRELLGLGVPKIWRSSTCTFAGPFGRDMNPAMPHKTREKKKMPKLPAISNPTR